jgi:hypothetical protein
MHRRQLQQLKSYGSLMPPLILLNILFLKMITTIYTRQNNAQAFYLIYSPQLPSLFPVWGFLLWQPILHTLKQKK